MAIRDALFGAPTVIFNQANILFAWLSWRKDLALGGDWEAKGQEAADSNGQESEFQLHNCCLLECKGTTIRNKVEGCRFIRVCRWCKIDHVRLKIMNWLGKSWYVTIYNQSCLTNFCKLLIISDACVRLNIIESERDRTFRLAHSVLSDPVQFRELNQSKNTNEQIFDGVHLYRTFNKLFAVYALSSTRLSTSFDFETYARY